MGAFAPGETVNMYIQIKRRLRNLQRAALKARHISRATLSAPFPARIVLFRSA